MSMSICIHISVYKLGKRNESSDDSSFRVCIVLGNPMLLFMTARGLNGELTLKHPLQLLIHRLEC